MSVTELRMPTTDELSEIERFIATLEGGYEVVIHVAPGSSWLVFHTRLWSWSGAPGTSPRTHTTYGMWRRTKAIFMQDDTGAMSDESIQEPEPRPSLREQTLRRGAADLAGTPEGDRLAEQADEEARR